MGDWGCKITTSRAFNKTNATFSAIILHFAKCGWQLLASSNAPVQSVRFSLSTNIELSVTERVPVN